MQVFGCRPVINHACCSQCQLKKHLELSYMQTSTHEHVAVKVREREVK